MKETLKLFAKRFGFNVSRNPDVIDFLHSRKINVLFDVGANEGQFAKFIRLSGYKNQIVSFEPIKSAFETLSLTMSGDRNWCGKNVGLGASRTTGIINVTENTVYSSLLVQTDYAVRHDQAARVSREEPIDIYPFDEVSGDISNKNAFLKIDTQGFEKNVLTGAVRSLPLILGLQLELPLQHLYEGDWRLSEAISFLEASGFVPAQMHATSLISEDRASWTEVDCVFRRA